MCIMPIATKVIIPVIPAGGITTRPSSPCLANIFRISAGFVSAGKFFTNIIVCDLCFGSCKEYITCR